jgi:hypothetical protein
MDKSKIWIKKFLMSMDKENFNRYKYKNTFIRTLPYHTLPLTALEDMDLHFKQVLFFFSPEAFTLLFQKPNSSKEDQKD